MHEPAPTSDPKDINASRGPYGSVTPAIAPALGRAAKLGSAWAITQSIASKLASFACQILLARLLLPAEMGLASKAISVHGLLLYLNPAIMSDVLIQRKATIDRDASPALWMTILAAIATGAVIAASGLIFAQWYGSGAVIGLLAVLAFRPLAMAMQVVSLTRLRMALRFRAISSWSIWVAVASSGATVLLAWLGCGPYAIVIPLVAMIAMLGVVFARLAPSGFGERPTLRGSGSIFREWFTLCGGQYAHTVSLYVDYLILALFASDAEVGFYFFAFNLSGQLNGVIVYNVSLVLQPIFAALRDEPERQMRAFLKVASTISSISVPLCLLQATLAETALRRVFGNEWMPAAPLLAILSLAQSFAFTIGPTTALLKSQGRFRTYLAWQLWQTGLLVPAVVVAAWLGARTSAVVNASALFVAWVIVVQFIVSAPLGLFVAIRPAGGSLREAARPFTRPLLAAAAIVAPLWYGGTLLPTTLGFDLIRMFGTPILVAAIYPLLLRVVDREAFETLLENLMAVLRRVRRSG